MKNEPETIGAVAKKNISLYCKSTVNGKDGVIQPLIGKYTSIKPINQIEERTERKKMLNLFPNFKSFVFLKMCSQPIP